MLATMTPFEALSMCGINLFVQLAIGSSSLALDDRLLVKLK
jgi:hypothetical protein